VFAPAVEGTRNLFTRGIIFSFSSAVDFVELRFDNLKTRRVKPEGRMGTIDFKMLGAGRPMINRGAPMHNRILF